MAHASQLFCSVPSIIRQAVAYRRLKTIEKFNMSAQKVDTYQRWSLARGGPQREVPTIGTNNFGFWKSAH